MDQWQVSLSFNCSYENNFQCVSLLWSTQTKRLLSCLTSFRSIYLFLKASTIFFKDISSEKLDRNFFARVKMIGTWLIPLKLNYFGFYSAFKNFKANIWRRGWWSFLTFLGRVLSDSFTDNIAVVYWELTSLSSSSMVEWDRAQFNNNLRRHCLQIWQILSYWPPV